MEIDLVGKEMEYASAEATVVRGNIASACPRTRPYGLCRMHRGEGHAFIGRFQYPTRGGPTVKKLLALCTVVAVVVAAIQVAHAGEGLKKEVIAGPNAPKVIGPVFPGDPIRHARLLNADRHRPQGGSCRRRA